MGSVSAGGPNSPRGFCLDDEDWDSKECCEPKAARGTTKGKNGSHLISDCSIVYLVRRDGKRDGEMTYRR